MGKLATALLMDRTTLTRGIRPLERAGYLRVSRSAKDARTKVVSITRCGERLLEVVYPVWVDVVANVRKTLGARMLTELYARLDRLIALSPEAERRGALRPGL